MLYLVDAIMIRMGSAVRLLSIAAMPLLLVVVSAAEKEHRVDFAREILPVLSDKCFICHGPDSEGQSDLRLDSIEGATADLGGYHAVVPSVPDESELVARIHDQDDPMPPADADRQLTDAERELLTIWIRQGGEYANHWAYVPPDRKASFVADSSIDHWIQARFPDGVHFAPEADRATLARRAALVLTGLPPDTELLNSFLGDPSGVAYETYIDRLLGRSSYGEHQARYWLDAVRYGDTHGLHLDNRRGIYPYRDWVIRALNRNQPFDEFLRWQLAGDLLPDPSLEQLVATGFVRMNPTTSEGGVIPAEFQAKNNFDRVETLGTALLGASFVCARCHTHKYDPITHTDYYEMIAFFNSTAESPLDGNAYEYGPTVEAPADIAAWEEWERLLAERELLLANVNVPQLEQAVSYAVRTSDWKCDNWRMSKPVGINDDLPHEGPEDPWEPVGDFPGSRGRMPKQDQAQWVAFDFETAMEQTLAIRLNGGAGSRVVVDGKDLELFGSVGLIRLPAGKTSVRLKIAGRNDGALPIRIEVQNAWKSLVETKAWKDCPDHDRLLMLADANGPLSQDAVRDDALKLANEMARAQSRFTTTLVARDLPQLRETKLLGRGEYSLPEGEPLQPAVPIVMGSLPADAPKNRLGLTQWLTSPENPLVTRVLVNRFWQQAFGYGLVRTPEDFGLQGEQPTHPELLDWLAIEFRESRWDLKSTLKQIVMSRTFRQESKWRDGIRDPENRMYARGPRFRLDAEVLRDMTLWSSGLMDSQMGGEGVKPWQPSGLWEAIMHPASNTKDYVADTDGRELRRSIYVYWKRTSPHPMMTLFDAPNRESSCVRRSRSNTPLQSLALLNEPQRLEAARALAGHLLSEGGDTVQSRLGMLFTLLACREPTVIESDACLNLLTKMRNRYAASPADAQTLRGAEQSPEAVEHAAWIQVVITVLASDISILLY